VLVKKRTSAFRSPVSVETKRRESLTDEEE